MGEYQYMTVTYLLDEGQKQALDELLPCWADYTAKDGTKPYAGYTRDKLEETVFSAIMTAGSKYDIDKRMKAEQFRQGLISIDEYAGS